MFRKLIKGIFIVFLALLAGFIVLVIFFVVSDRPNGDAATPRPAPTATAPQPRMPTSQADFAAVIDRYAQDWRQQPNEMARGALRPARAREICAVMRNAPRGERWVGTIKTLSSNNSGLGVLAIRVTPRMTVETWNNELSDIGVGSLIDPQSTLHAAVVRLRVGQAVTFLGSLISDREDCFKEKSLTVTGAMTEPAFLMKFTDVRPVE